MSLIGALLFTATPALAQTFHANIDSPVYNSTVAQPFTVSGWAVNTAHPTGTGVSDVYAYGCLASNCVWEFWGVATYGLPRPDVAAHFGHARFTNSGFSLAVSGNPAGLHLIQLVIYDTVAGVWQPVATQATLLTAPAQSITTINTPTNQQAVTQPFSLSGWAIDWGATSGTGVDIVGGWTYPHPGSGQPSVSLGATTYGGAQPDVRWVYGDQFLNSGFQKSVSGLVAGPHLMGVSAHSTVSGIWHGKSVPLVFIDMPTSPLTIDRPGTGTGAVTASGLSCPGGAATVAVPCGATYTSQTVVTLTAVADAGSTFGGWGGACSGTGTCQVTMAGAKLVTATFVKTAATVTTRYYHTDIIGSVRAITKENGDVDTRHDYRPFGEDTQPLDGDPNRFAGKQLDPETALHYFDARYYRQTWGRFTQVDPLHVGAALTQPQRWNRYAYAGNNPLKYVDPTGLAYLICSRDAGWSCVGHEITYSVLIDWVEGDGWSMSGGPYGGTFRNGRGHDVGDYEYYCNPRSCELGESALSGPDPGGPDSGGPGPGGPGPGGPGPGPGLEDPGELCPSCHGTPVDPPKPRSCLSSCETPGPPASATSSSSKPSWLPCFGDAAVNFAIGWTWLGLLGEIHVFSGRGAEIADIFDLAAGAVDIERDAARSAYRAAGGDGRWNALQQQVGTSSGRKLARNLAKIDGMLALRAASKALVPAAIAMNAIDVTLDFRSCVGW